MTTMTNVTGTSTMTTPAPAPASRIEIHQGTTAALGRCHIGVVAVTASAGTATAVLSLADADTNVETTIPTRAGSLLAACGQLVRVVDVIAAPARPNLPPGADGDRVVLDSTPVVHPGAAFVAGNPVLVPGGSTRVGGSSILLRSVATGKATLGHWPSPLLPSEADADKLTSVEVAAGDVVVLAAGKHRVRTVVAPAPAAGVPGWLELELVPTP